MSKKFWEWLEQHDAGHDHAQNAPLLDPANPVR
jgi:hypothetical protein